MSYLRLVAGFVISSAELPNSVTKVLAALYSAFTCI